MSTHDVGKFYSSKRTTSSQIESDNDQPDSSLTTKVDLERRQESAEKTVKLQGPSKPKKCRLVPESLWKVFPRQQMAFDFSHQCYQSSAVFSYESEEFGREGQRKYLVTTYYEFGQRYLFMKCPRHYYEVITEDSACHLYFDIEYKTELNPQVDGIALLDIFIKYICYQLFICFGLSCDRSNVLDLESSTPIKFSRHLVFHLPSSSFRNNIHAGHFVHYCCEKLRSFKLWVDSGTHIHQAYEQSFLSPDKQKTVTRNQTRAKQIPSCPSTMDLKSLFILSDQGKETLLVDEGVYTRNRNFRLYLSSKLGKGVPLLVSKENRFRSTYRENSLKRRRSQKFNTLMDSLVCNVSFEACSRVLEFAEPSLSARRKSSMAKTGHREDEKDAAAAGYSMSPFPLIDKFITSTLTKEDSKGNIRRWTYFSQGKQLVYDIQHYRWCENINRAHKSNNVMIIADLMRGVFYQKCHDPECKRINFRSKERSIPVDYNPVAKRGLDDRYTNVVTDDEGLETGDHLSTLVGELSYEELLEMEQDMSEPQSTTLTNTTKYCTDTTGVNTSAYGYCVLEVERTKLKVESKEQCNRPLNLNQSTDSDNIGFDQVHCDHELNVPIQTSSNKQSTSDADGGCGRASYTDSLLLEALESYEACSMHTQSSNNIGGLRQDVDLKLSRAELRSSELLKTAGKDDHVCTGYSLSAEEMESFCENLESDTF